MQNKNLMPPRMAFGDEELRAIKELFAYYKKKRVDFGYQGEYERLYTDAFVRYMGGYGYADAVCTGTSAIFVALASLELKPGSQVIVSAITDPGTINAIILNRLVPVLADNAAGSYNMGVQEFAARISKRTKAVVVVHVAGKPAPIDEISRIAKRNNLSVIEDCSQAHGARYKGKKVGSFSDVAAFSTMYRKAHSTGGCGGVIFTRKKAIYQLVRSYADRGKPFYKAHFDEKDPATFMFPALNLNLDELSCAIGLVSLRKLENMRRKRCDFIKSLDITLKKYSKTCKVLEPSQDDSPFFQPISVDTSKLACSKINFARAIQSKGVTVNPHYKYVVCEWPWVRSYLGDDFICANAIDIRDKTFNLLFNENYGQKEIAFIKNAICKTENKYLKF